MMPRLLLLALPMLAGVTAPRLAAQADTTAAARAPGRLTIGAGVVSIPAYPGSNDRRVLPLPVVGIDLGRGWIGAGTEGATGGAGLYLRRGAATTWTLELGGTLNRRAAWSDDLAGFADRGAGVALGMSTRTALGPVVAGLAGTWGLTRGTGRTATVSLGAGRALARRVRLGGTVGATFADRRNMAWDFGVGADDAAGSGRPVFMPSGGLREVRASLAPALALGARTQLAGFGSVTWLGSRAAASPLVRRRATWEAGVALAWRP